MAPGAYAYRPGRGLELIRAGASARGGLPDARSGARRDAAATIFFLAPLDAFFARGATAGIARPTSRPGSSAAGVPGGLRRAFGATGLTFYVREVVRFFSPHAAGTDAIFVTALGAGSRARRRATIEHDPTAAQEVVSR